MQTGAPSNGIEIVILANCWQKQNQISNPKVFFLVRFRKLFKSLKRIHFWLIIGSMITNKSIRNLPQSDRETLWEHFIFSFRALRI